MFGIRSYNHDRFAPPDHRRSGAQRVAFRNGFQSRWSPLLPAIRNHSLRSEKPFDNYTLPFSSTLPCDEATVSLDCVINYACHFMYLRNALILNALIFTRPMTKDVSLLDFRNLSLLGFCFTHTHRVSEYSWANQFTSKNRQWWLNTDADLTAWQFWRSTYSKSCVRRVTHLDVFASHCVCCVLFCTFGHFLFSP